jgi:hypothetical protein
MLLKHQVLEELMLDIVDTQNVGSYRNMVKIFELIHTFEFEISGEKDSINGKFELLRDIENETKFKLRIFALEMFQLKTAFLDETENGLVFSHETIWVEAVLPGKDSLEKEFNANNVEEAKKKLFLESITFTSILD